MRTDPKRLSLHSKEDHENVFSDLSFGKAFLRRYFAFGREVACWSMYTRSTRERLLVFIFFWRPWSSVRCLFEPFFELFSSQKDNTTIRKWIRHHFELTLALKVSLYRMISVVFAMISLGCMFFRMKGTIVFLCCRVEVIQGRCWLFLEFSWMVLIYLIWTIGQSILVRWDFVSSPKRMFLFRLPFLSFICFSPRISLLPPKLRSKILELFSLTLDHWGKGKLPRSWIGCSKCWKTNSFMATSKRQRLSDSFPNIRKVYTILFFSIVTWRWLIKCAMEVRGVACVVSPNERSTGTFLVRFSSRSPGNYTLSVRSSENKIAHIRLPGMGGEVCDSVCCFFCSQRETEGAEWNSDVHSFRYTLFWPPRRIWVFPAPDRNTNPFSRPTHSTSLSPRLPIPVWAELPGGGGVQTRMCQNGSVGDINCYEWDSALLGMDRCRVHGPISVEWFSHCCVMCCSIWMPSSTPSFSLTVWKEERKNAEWRCWGGR